MFRIATWNVNSLRVRLPHVLEWLNSESPDVLALQETKLTNEDFPAEAFLPLGYQAVFSGQKTYNGVATLSKLPATNIITGLPEYADTQKRVLCTDINDITILNLYVPNGSEVGSDKYAYKMEWFSHLHPFVRDLLASNKKLAILGDFNVAPEDRDVHDPEEWAGSVLVSDAERAEFRKLLAAGLADSFRLFEHEEKSFSWWDYRAAAFRRNRGLRIDHILVNQALASICSTCRIDKRPRTLERPSDHAPVIADFNLQAA
ncbi:MAG: exodeoxyribonuclease III [Gammaproteobacteria bacterium RIFCSPLOWO2_01_FULL_47_190]|nr:MAG: exodeoxyribonuclease III [Gammaproteobacteria bacterium RIFCSPLOWO2_01_FULL_47_190]OGT74528.1 MAG: exodeoxyribonuclease III [Gammaproteobacteria bacterium RIFCSPLOWO2_12_47_11]OGT83331.1 MAG: exodeoxyribonuclease III [Gammaproteobacteria bacterium RIFCSPLOWO2_12_FULL_47_76]